MGRFTVTNPIIQNDDVLRDEWKPNELLEREHEDEMFTQALLPVSRGAQASNIFVYGRTGTGKTLSTKLVFEELKEEAKDWDLDIRTIRVSCRDRTAYKVAINVINRITDGQRISKTGHQTSVVLDRFFEEINKLEADHIFLILDEIDNFETDASLLYQIPRARDEGLLDDDKMMSMVGISNDFLFRDKLDPQIQSTLGEVEIEFDPYDATQLQTILNDRVEKALVSDDVIDDSVVPWISAKTAQKSGSARYAIEVLRIAANRAERHDDPKITEEHARVGVQEVEKEELVEQTKNMITQTQLVLAAVSHLDRDGQTPVARQQIYQKYKQLAKIEGFEALSGRSVHRTLKDLMMYSFLHGSEVNQGMSGGRRYEYSLDVDADLVEKGLTDQLSLFGDDKGSDTESTQAKLTD